MRALVAVVLAGCFEAPGYDGTMYKCDVDPVCPEGFTCDMGVCTAMPAPAGMVGVAAGSFRMGCMPGVDCMTDAQPQHDVRLSAFAIDKSEVTEAQFQLCIDAGACLATTVPITGNTPNAPVRGVTWMNAKNYCTFMTKQLPTEAQWERAARTVMTALFPWAGDLFDCTRANALPCARGGVVDESALPLGNTPQGIMQMSGNVREWVLDSYDEAFYAADPSPLDPRNETTSNIKVVRGGSFRTDVPNLKVWFRDSEDMLHGGTAVDGDDLGVRCAKPL